MYIFQENRQQSKPARSQEISSHLKFATFRFAHSKLRRNFLITSDLFEISAHAFRIYDWTLMP